MKLRPFFAELVATFLFVLAVVGSMVAMAMPGSSFGALGPALVHGLAFAVLISATAHTGGGQINPAVSIAYWLGNQISLRQAIANIVAQVFGGFLAIHALLFALGQDRLESVNFGVPTPGEGIGLYEALFLEALFTFLLVLVLFGTMLDKRSPKVNGLYAGLALTLASLTIGPFTGACLNPARYLGPALQGGGYENLVTYTCGPIFGAAIAALFYTYGIGREDRLDLPGDEA